NAGRTGRSPDISTPDAILVSDQRARSFDHRFTPGPEPHDQTTPLPLATKHGAERLTAYENLVRAVAEMDPVLPIVLLISQSTRQTGRAHSNARTHLNMSGIQATPPSMITKTRVRTSLQETHTPVVTGSACSSSGSGRPRNPTPAAGDHFRCCLRRDRRTAWTKSSGTGWCRSESTADYRRPGKQTS
ncbi:MAG: hypothetical protein QG671_883, partial [Actinomycetota bacterium]|nr:hypothetical protein [Actinomycetota bacterium]